ncbi:15366_t:CDS:10 [Funneliformis geosporum]|nr:15366_t:CDS:10 [Funneliformis geosporum]
MVLTVVFTGTLKLDTREAHEARAQKNGYKVVKFVMKSTTFLVCGKDGGQIIQKAKSIGGVRVISEEKWMKVLGNMKTAKAGYKRARSDNNSENRYQKKLVYLESHKYNRFWQMRRVYKTTYIRTGSIGAKGMETSKEHETKKLAKDSMASMIAAKKSSGYKGARRPQELDYDDSSDSSDENENENVQVSYSPQHKQKKQRTDIEENKEDSSYQTDSTLREDDVELNETDVQLIDMGQDTPVPAQDAEIKKSANVYSCNCPDWKKATKEEKRTCKHLKNCLGEKSEINRFDNKKILSTLPMSIMKGNSVDVLLAHSWKPDEVDPTGWWVSEKLDGVRAFWNSKRGKFYSRNGNEFVAPSWFTDGIPRDQDLDGELFGGRGTFQSTISIVKAGDKEWKNISYKVFDVPTLGRIPFEERMDFLEKMIEENKPKYARFVKQRLVKSEADVYDELDRVEKLGGEGLMLRKPGSLYEAGRSKTLLKVKTFHDGEAIVISHEPGKGKYLRQCGALRCEMACGKEFKVGSGMNDHDRANPPPIGSIILYRCQELTKDGSPRFPVYLGVALDKNGPMDPNFSQKIKCVILYKMSKVNEKRIREIEFCSVLLKELYTEYKYSLLDIDDDNVERDEKMQTSNHMTNAMGSDNNENTTVEYNNVSDEDIDIENASQVSVDDNNVSDEDIDIENVSEVAVDEHNERDEDIDIENVSENADSQSVGDDEQLENDGNLNEFHDINEEIPDDGPVDDISRNIIDALLKDKVLDKVKESRDDLAFEILLELINECTLDVAFEVHRQAKTGILVKEFVNAQSYQSKDFNDFSNLICEEGYDIYGQDINALKSQAAKQRCLNCSVMLPVATYVKHFSKCLGLVKGRTATRNVNYTEERIENFSVFDFPGHSPNVSFISNAEFNIEQDLIDDRHMRNHTYAKRRTMLPTQSLSSNTKDKMSTL